MAGQYVFPKCLCRHEKTADDSPLANAHLLVDQVQVNTVGRAGRKQTLVLFTHWNLQDDICSTSWAYPMFQLRVDELCLP
jgi:hypothetical protein